MTLEEYLRMREGKGWSAEDTEHVLDHIRDVEATWKQVSDLAKEEALRRITAKTFKPKT